MAVVACGSPAGCGRRVPYSRILDRRTGRRQRVLKVQEGRARGARGRPLPDPGGGRRTRAVRRGQQHGGGLRDKGGDVATACQLPVLGPAPGLNMVLAAPGRHVLHQIPYSEQLISRRSEGWAAAAPDWRPTPAPRPGGELVPPIQAAVNFAFTPIELNHRPVRRHRRADGQGRLQRAPDRSVRPLTRPWHAASTTTRPAGFGARTWMGRPGGDGMAISAHQLLA